MNKINLLQATVLLFIGLNAKLIASNDPRCSNAIGTFFKLPPKGKTSPPVLRDFSLIQDPSPYVPFHHRTKRATLVWCKAGKFKNGVSVDSLWAEAVKKENDNIKIPYLGSHGDRTGIILQSCLIACPLGKKGDVFETQLKESFAESVEAAALTLGKSRGFEYLPLKVEVQKRRKLARDLSDAEKQIITQFILKQKYSKVFREYLEPLLKDSKTYLAGFTTDSIIADLLKKGAIEKSELSAHKALMHTIAMDALIYSLVRPYEKKHFPKIKDKRRICKKGLYGREIPIKWSQNFAGKEYQSQCEMMLIWYIIVNHAYIFANKGFKYIKAHSERVLSRKLTRSETDLITKTIDQTIASQ